MARILPMSFNITMTRISLMISPDKWLVELQWSSLREWLATCHCFSPSLWLT